MAKFCTNCGQSIEEGVNNCPNCGASVNNKNNTASNANTGVNNGAASKSKIAAGILGILLGAVGAHNFYLGYTGKAVAQLLISILSCGVLSFVSGVWGLVEGIMILTGSINTDAQGNPLAD